MTTHGFLVGIEKYDEPGWDVAGPCSNALAMAAWLSSLPGAAGGNIHVFLCPSRDLSPEIDELKSKGVDVRMASDAAAIDAFWRVELARDVPADSRLFVFWSGHGFTSKSRNRMFFCGDYRSRLPRVFHATNFLNHLLTADYACFSDQIVLADVCGVFSDTEVPETPDKLEMASRNQLAYFATPEGQYAKGEAGRGVFTETALGILREAGGWPTQAGFMEALDKATSQAGVKPFRIWGRCDQGELRETVVGGNTHFHAVVELLAPLDIVEGVFQPHYLRTAANLGNPELAKARGLKECVSQLSTLGGSDVSQGIPAGMLQFLLRLATEQALREPIEQWLQTHAAGQKNTIADIRSKLEIETQNRILVIVTETSPRESIVAYKPYLFGGDGVILPGRRYDRQPAAGWKQFERSLQKLLGEFIVDDRLCNLEIHFVVEASLFDRAFHLIPLADGGKRPIGEDAVVVVRHKQRMFTADQKTKTKWRECADNLRAATPGALKWVRLAMSEELPEDKGLFFAGFTMPQPVEGRPAGRAEKELLRRLLQLGIPYVYLPLGSPEAPAWDDVEARLTTLLTRAATLEKFPPAILDERIRRSRIGKNATLIWDDPGAVALDTIEGVRFT